MEEDKILSAVAVFDKYASEYSERFRDTSVYHESFDVFCECINNNGEILELACGPGNITKYILSKRPDLNILATDLSPRMLEVAKQENRSVKFQLMDCRDLKKLHKQFDGIIMGFCLPYLSLEETKQIFIDAAGSLHTKGAVYISTMENDYTATGIHTSSKGDKLFMHFYTESLLTELLENAGLHIKWKQRKLTLDASDNEVTDLLIVALKN